jgi:hypothetical protein
MGIVDMLNYIAVAKEDDLQIEADDAILASGNSGNVLRRVRYLAL